MAEELEPLFDYTRVQPQFILVDDDEDDDALFLSKRKKTSPTVEKVQEGGGKVINIDDREDNDDVEWLVPPPKVPVDKTKVRENSVIKELREKKEELLSFTKSSNDIFQHVEESVKRDLNTSMKSASEGPMEKPSKPAAERPKIVISIQDKDGQQPYRVYKDDRFEKLFKKYADSVKNKVENLVFSFDGDKIDPTTTPSSLEMEDDDMIEVHVK